VARQVALQVAISAPMVISKIVLGVALLTFMVDLGVQRGLGSLVTLHTLLCLPFRLSRDLGAPSHLWPRLRGGGAPRWAPMTSAPHSKVTVPLLGAALLGAFLLCVTVSFDEFSATQFLAVPRTQTMPIQIYSMIQTGVTPTVQCLRDIVDGDHRRDPASSRQMAFGVFRRTFVR
jgi:ABC-type spermidine/putrescine transport system permease subunit II